MGKHRPYIGITDFTSVQQAHALANLLQELGCDRLLHVGVMMSYKTLHGLESKWARVFPAKEKLRTIFREHPRVMNTLHYADYEGCSTLKDLLQAAGWAGSALNAFQFDMVWPEPSMLRQFREVLLRSEMPDVKFIIQVNASGIERLGGDPDQVAQMLYRYHEINCLDYALFDLSAGRGVPMDGQYLLKFIWPAVVRMRDLSIAVAGGLGPGTVSFARPVLDILPSTSLDAQGRLRSSGNALDPIDWGRATLYIKEAVKLLQEYSVS